MQKNKRKYKSYLSRIFILAGMVLSVSLLCFFYPSLLIKGRAAGTGDKKTVIVIDPGHGGENQGASYNGVKEKDITLRVAFAMKRELENYENVKVYLTRNKDKGLELSERAQYAKDKDADIILSLHFNMSEAHLNSGCEMWVSSQGVLMARAMEFAAVENELLTQLGLSKSMTNTRLNELNQDYYGVIRESAIRQIPACIVEHCYLDCPEEYRFYDSYQALEELGKLDATAVAMTYHLKSTKLGVDYSKLQKKDIKLPERVTKEDSSGPLYVGVTVSGYSKKKNHFLIDLDVVDNESSIVEYQYSLRGGDGFSEPFPIFAYEGKATVEVPALMNEKLVIRVGNAYNLHMDSEIMDMNPYYEEYVGKRSENLDTAEFLERIEEEFLDSGLFESGGFCHDEWWVDSEKLPMHRAVMLFGAMLGVAALTGYMVFHFFYLNKKTIKIRS